MPKLSALHHQAFLQLQECYQEQIKQVKNIPLNLANLIEIYSGPRDQVVAFKICLETLKNEEVFKENIPPFIDEFQRCKLMRVCRLLFAAGILNSIDAVDNFNLIVKHKNLNALLLVFEELESEQRLKEHLTQSVFEKIANHPSPLALLRVISLLKQANLCIGQDAKNNFDLILDHKSIGLMAKLLQQSQVNELLFGEKGQIIFTVLMNHPNPTYLIDIFNHLVQSNLFKEQIDSDDYIAVAKHENLISLIEAIKLLESAKLQDSKHAKVIFRELINCRNLLSATSGLMKLKRCGMFLMDEVQENMSAVIKHKKPELLAEILTRLYSSCLMDKENALMNIQAASEYSEPESLNAALKILTATTTLNSRKQKQRNFLDLCNYPKPELLASVLKILNETDLLVGQEEDSIRESLSKHPNLYDFSVALNMVFNHGLLFGKEAKLNFEVILNHDVPRSASAALIELKNASLLYHKEAGSYRKAILRHPHPDLISGALKELNDQGMLYGEKQSHLCSAISKSDNPYAVARALIRLKRTKLLDLGYSAIIYEAIGVHEKPYALATALEELKTGGLLQGKTAPLYLKAVINHEKPWEIATVLKKLKTLNKASEKWLGVLINDLRASEKPENLIRAFKRLDKAGLLAGKDANLNYKTIAQHPEPLTIANALWRLSSARMLEGSEAQIYREAVANHENPEAASWALVLCCQSGLFQGEKAEKNRETILKHDNIWSAIDALDILRDKDLLGESNPQDTYDLLIIPYANLLFGDKDLKELWEKLEPHSMSADDIKEIRQQSSPDDVKQMAIYKLLSCTEVLAYAESHLDQFQQYVDPYVDQYILTLMESIQINGSNGELIDLGESEANHVFYLLKNLIRRNEENHNLMISWLAAIPQIQNIVRRDLASEAQSELLRLAMSVHNETATEIMLNISMLESPSPETRTSGLWEIAQDKESSMKALTDVEQVILDRVYDHYRTKLDKEGGGQNFFKQFKEYLAKNYQKAPAYCMLADKKINLPLDWYDFKDLLADLKLNDHARKEFQAHALKAYYQHTAHTAYRFLSKPNHWMAKNASYVCGNPQRGQGYAYFEAYQEMIAYFWLAASDEETPAIDNFTIEERQAQFITSLALIGRAHNWDENRLKNKTFEEYDDLKGDNPSCYSGIKRRLFHSVLGHPMFKILTKEILAQELNSFVYNYYKKVISTDNSKLIRAELMKKFYLEEPGKNYIPFDLKKVDIEERQQAGFLKELEDKYGKQVNYFQKDISLFFNPKPCEYHIEKFYQQIEHLLDNPVNSQKSPMVFFATKRIPSQECNEQQPDNRYSKL